MAIGDLNSRKGSTVPAPIGASDNASPRASAQSSFSPVWFTPAFFGAGLAIMLLALSDFTWGLTSLRFWFVIPAGYMAVGAGVGAIFGLTYLWAQRKPARGDLILASVAAIGLYFCGDYFHYKNMVYESEDGVKVSVSEVIPYGEYFEFHFHGKREIRARPGSTPIKFDANPGYEMLMFGLGILLMGVVSAGAFMGLTEGDFCTRCNTYYKKTNAHTRFMSTPDELLARVEASERAGFGSPDSISELFRPVDDKAPPEEKRFSLSVETYKCNCGQQVIKRTVSKFAGNEWREVGELSRKASSGPADIDLSSVVEKHKKAG